MIYLGIDPSINNVGLALYDSISGELRTACYHPPKGRIVFVSCQIARYILVSFLQREKRPEKIVIEYPQWENSERGRIAMQKGYTLDLAFIVGYLCGSLGIAASSCFTPTPREWKKNLPKKVIEHRFRKKFLVDAKIGISDHEFEAAMMIDWLIEQQ